MILFVTGAEAPEVWNENLDDLDWEEILPTQKLGAHKKHFYRGVVSKSDRYTHIKVTIKPDGGISRIRLFGIATSQKAS